MNCLTTGQLQVLRKLSLLKLTALIEKHCPTHKTGWNWELPKFIRKVKSPDYKGVYFRINIYIWKIIEINHFQIKQFSKYRYLYVCKGLDKLCQ